MCFAEPFRDFTGVTHVTDMCESESLSLIMDGATARARRATLRQASATLAGVAGLMGLTHEQLMNMLGSGLSTSDLVGIVAASLSAAVKPVIPLDSKRKG
jgi:hypothetical protein